MQYEVMDVLLEKSAAKRRRPAIKIQRGCDANVLVADRPFNPDIPT